MKMNPLPPQAYTKDTLQKAYSWLVSQDISIQEMATTADILVSLYLKAHRDGEGALQRPSIQNFKNELKNLAPIVEEFERTGQKIRKSHSLHHLKQNHSRIEIDPSDLLESKDAHEILESPKRGAGVQNSSEETLDENPLSPVETLDSTKSFRKNQLNSLEVIFSQSIQNSQITHLVRANESDEKTPENRLPLDEISLQLIKDTRQTYNLSTDIEALRLLIKVGYSKAKSLIKDNT